MTATRHGSAALRYEDAAVLKTVQVWECVVCQHLYHHEHQARMCHARDVPCDVDGCQNRSQFDGRGRCRECAGTRAIKNWEQRYAENAEDWDGESPLYSEAYERWVAPWDADDVEELRAEVGEWTVCNPELLASGVDCDKTERRPARSSDHSHEHFVLPSLEDLRLALCAKDDPPAFDIGEWCQDHLPDDDGDGRDMPGTAEEQSAAEKAVNDYLETHSPWSWSPTRTPARLEPLRVGA